MPLNGEQLETLAALAAAYDAIVAAESVANERKKQLRQEILDLLRSGGERDVAVAGLRIFADARERTSIPVDLARKLLPEEYFTAIVQTSLSVVLTIKSATNTKQED